VVRRGLKMTVSGVKKIITVTTLKRKLQSHRREGRSIAFTNGCFDILHYGHVSYLERAAKGNRILIVGLNSDRSVRKLKGPQRPINAQRARARVMAALACVDYVTLFDAATPLELIKAVKPDVLIKGADWKDRPVVGSELVRSWGGRVEFIRFERGFSTTQLIKKIKHYG